MRERAPLSVILNLPEINSSQLICDGNRIDSSKMEKLLEDEKNKL